MEDLESKYGEIICDLCFENQSKGTAEILIEGVRYLVDFSYYHTGGLEGFYIDEYTGTLYVGNEAYYFNMKDIFCSGTEVEVERDYYADLTKDDDDYWEGVKYETDKDLQCRLQNHVHTGSICPEKATGSDLDKLAELVGIIRKPSQEPTINLNKQEENIMTTANTRTLYTVILIDDDKNLPAEDSLVAKFKNVLSEESTEVIIQEILMEEDVKGMLAKHNEKRSKIVNQTIRERTGADVYLQPVKIKDLVWQVK